jgi:CheY-like chemotaxis protein
MVMPGGLSGLDLCARLRQMKSGLRTLVTSGYSAEIVDSGGAVGDAVGDAVVYLPKPYTLASLAAAIRSCLDARER